jgi:hypothetical protein
VELAEMPRQVALIGKSRGGGNCRQRQIAVRRLRGFASSG